MRQFELRFEKDEEKGFAPVLVNLSQKSFRLVKEFMIISNHHFAKFCEENNVPTLYRCQSAPRENFKIKPNYSEIKTNHLLLQNQSPTQVKTESGWHHSLGLPYYIQATSPLRRYLDFVCQNQVVSILNPKIRAFNSEELITRYKITKERALQIRKLERLRKTFWLCQWLSKNKNEFESEAEVLDSHGSDRVLVWVLALNMTTMVKHKRLSIGSKGKVKVKGIRGIYRQDVQFEFVKDPS